MLALALSLLALSPDELLARVQTTYAKGGDLEARFEQVHVEKLRGKKKVEGGKLWAMRDGRVRWSYEQPIKKDFIYDGKSAYFYEPASAQVTIFEKFQDSPLWNALRFLWGQGSLQETFSVKACVEGCPKAETGETLLWLSPKEPVAAVDHVVLAIDEASTRVRRSIVYDALGNRTEYHFKDLTLGAKIEAKKFDFKIPEGVSIQRATGDSQK